MTKAQSRGNGFSDVLPGGWGSCEHLTSCSKKGAQLETRARNEKLTV